MKNQNLFFEKSGIERLIEIHSKNDTYRKDELVVALMLTAMCEKMWQQEVLIGMPLKESQVNTVNERGTSDDIELKKLLEKVEQSSDVDIIIVKKSGDLKNLAGQTFQIKNFDTHQKDTSTASLVSFIKKLNYQKTETALVILIQTGESTKFREIRDSLDFSKFPFSALYTIGVYGNIMRLVEIWPNSIKKEEVKINWYAE